MPDTAWLCDNCGWKHVNCDYLKKCDGCAALRSLIPQEAPPPEPETPPKKKKAKRGRSQSQLD